jgi:hypothetical protein
MFPRWNFIMQKLKHVSKVKFQNVKIKWIFSEIKTWFQGEISECRNKTNVFKNYNMVPN